MTGQHSGGFPIPGVAQALGGFNFSKFNLGKMYQMLLAHDHELARLRKAMTQSNDDLAALETEFSDAITAIATEIEQLHGQIASGNTTAVSRLKPLADKLRDLAASGTSTQPTSPVVPPEAANPSTAPSTDTSVPATDTSNPDAASGV